MKVAITPSSFAAVNHAPLERLQAAGIEVKGNPWGRRLTKEEAMSFLSDCDGVVAGLEPLDADVLENCPNLKAIARVGIGVANVDFAAADKHGIKVSNTPGGPTEAVAEMTLTACLAMLRDLVARNAALHLGEWPKHVALGLSGLPVLFVGFGRIGRRTGELFHALGAQILVFDPYADPASFPDWIKSVASLKEGLEACRVVTLHCSGEDEVIGSKELAHLPDASFLLNSARGGLVNEQAVCDALDSGKLKGVWMDAFATEPYQGPLADRDGALLTPHAATYTEQCRLSMEGEAVENLLRDLKQS